MREMAMEQLRAVKPMSTGLKMCLVASLTKGVKGQVYREQVSVIVSGGIGMAAMTPLIYSVKSQMHFICWTERKMIKARLDLLRTCCVFVNSVEL